MKEILKDILRELISIKIILLDICRVPNSKGKNNLEEITSEIDNYNKKRRS